MILVLLCRPVIHFKLLLYRLQKQKLPTNKTKQKKQEKVGESFSLIFIFPHGEEDVWEKKSLFH